MSVGNEHKGFKMKKDNKQVMNALVLVFQFGINMVVPIFLCCIIGIWIGDKTGISWMMIPFFFIGALAGFTNIYKMARKLIEKVKHKRSGGSDASSAEILSDYEGTE